MAAVRTWTYVANQASWVEHAPEWQERTRAVEDRLSDALHERLVRRFVDQHAKPRAARARPRATRAAGAPADEDVVHASHPFAKLREMRDAMAARAAPPAAKESARWVDEIVDAPFESFSLGGAGVLSFGAEPVAAIAPGPSIVLPEVRLLDTGPLGAGARAQLLRRLTAYARDVVGELLAPLRATQASAVSAAARGLVYRLEQGLGTAIGSGYPSTSEDTAEEPPLAEDDCAALLALGVSAGSCVAYVPRLLSADAVSLRATLASVHYLGRRRFVVAPKAGRVSVAPERGTDSAALSGNGLPGRRRPSRSRGRARADRRLGRPGGEGGRELARVLGEGRREGRRRVRPSREGGAALTNRLSVVTLREMPSLFAMPMAMPMRSSLRGAAVLHPG